MAAAKVSAAMGWAQPSRRWLARCSSPAMRQVGPVAASGGQAGLQVTLEGEEQLGRLLVEDQHGGSLLVRRPGGGGEAGRQGLELQGVAAGYRRRDGWGADLAAA